MAEARETPAPLVADWSVHAPLFSRLSKRDMKALAMAVKV